MACVVDNPLKPMLEFAVVGGGGKSTCRKTENLFFAEKWSTSNSAGQKRKGWLVPHCVKQKCTDEQTAVVISQCAWENASGEPHAYLQDQTSSPKYFGGRGGGVVQSQKFVGHLSQLRTCPRNLGLGTDGQTSNQIWFTNECVPSDPFGALTETFKFEVVVWSPASVTIRIFLSNKTPTWRHWQCQSGLKSKLASLQTSPFFEDRSESE